MTRCDSVSDSQWLLSLCLYHSGCCTTDQVVPPHVVAVPCIPSTHHNTSQHITTHNNTTQHNTTQHNTSHHITSHHITSHHITSHHITSHHITSHHITSQHNTSHPLSSTISNKSHKICAIGKIKVNINC